MTIAIICGGRTFNETAFVNRTLDMLHSRRPFKFVFTGGASGADYIADHWAKTRGVDRIQVWANWEGRGDRAGPFRNALMLRLAKPDVLVAFPGEKGTQDMIRQARAAGVKVMEIRFEERKG